MAITPPPYTLTNASITVVWEGKPHTVQKGSPNFNALRKAIIEEKWAAIPKNLTVAKSIKDWAKGKFTLADNVFSFEGMPLPSGINGRILKMATSGEDPTPLFKFWERLQKNPSMRSVEQLWPFLDQKGIPITKDGHFLAYKGVKSDFMDAHTGTISNKPGTKHVMPRNQISDDPNHACHEGFHVGALEYARTFSQRVVICEVDPEHVVCVPYDSSQQKMRVCEYKVIGNHNGSYMSSTTHSEETEEAETNDETFNAKGTAADAPADYDVNNDFLAEPCDECGNKIPPDCQDEDNKFHDLSCSLFDPDRPIEETAPAPAKPAKKTGKQKKKEHKAKKKAGKVMAQSFDKLKKMDMVGLLNESLDSLRAYAGKGLQIVGASKIPGGKTALVSVILKTRG